jgi:hypothetical protein
MPACHGCPAADCPGAVRLHVRGCCMSLGSVRRHRSVARLALVLLLSLLFQQVAIASYACPIDRMPAESEAGMPDCASMAETDPQALCEKHCNPDDSTTPDPRVAAAPVVILPPVKFDLARSVPARHGPRTYASVPAALSDPPPIVRFCSLLI